MRGLRYLRLLLVGVMCILTLLSLAPAGASSANISHSYSASGAVPIGSLVSLDPKQPDYVVPANSSNAEKLLGIAVESKDSLLAVDASNTKVQIATAGTASALVSTLNGDIKVGDQIAVSPFAGVGMKAEPGSHLIGLAQTSLNATSDGVNTQTVTDTKGNKKDIVVGFVRINVGISVAPRASNDQNLNALQKLVKSTTGSSVSTMRALLSVLIAVGALLALVTLIYASIYGSIISIGRNPLAQYAIFRTLGSVLSIAVLIAAVASVTIFLLLHA